jgi:hypothetical protein
MVKDLWGKLFGDKGYISQPLSALLHAQGLRLVTRLKKNISQVEHTRHRSLWNVSTG